MSKENIEVVKKIIELLNNLIETSEVSHEEKQPNEEKTIEMLTVKECTEVVKGLSEYTVRKLIQNNKLPYIHTGQGKRGKILINKADLIQYFN